MRQNKNTLGWDETLTSHLELCTPVRLGRSTFLKRIPMGFPVFNVATTWDSVVVSDCVSAQAYKNVLLTCIQYSFDRSTRMDINTAMKRKIQVCMHVNIQVVYLCYLHTEASLDTIWPLLPPAMFEHKASTGWPSQTDATIALPTHMPCADSMPKCSKSTGISYSQN